MTQALLKTVSSVMNFSSPTKARSPKIESFRENADQYLANLDTRLTEFGASVSALILSYQVVVLHDSSTPFLSSALRILHLPLDSWALLLGIVGFAQFIGFTSGFRSNLSCCLRAKISAFAALAWFFAVAAIATTVPFVFAAILRYVLSVIVNGIMFLALNARCRHVKMWDGNNENAQPGTSC